MANLFEVTQTQSDVYNCTISLCKRRQSEFDYECRTNVSVKTVYLLHFVIIVFLILKLCMCMHVSVMDKSVCTMLSVDF